MYPNAAVAQTEPTSQEQRIALYGRESANDARAGRQLGIGVYDFYDRRVAVEQRGQRRVQTIEGYGTFWAPFDVRLSTLNEAIPASQQRFKWNGELKAFVDSCTQQVITPVGVKAA